MHRIAAVFPSVALLMAPVLHAQPRGMPSDIEWKLAERGAVVDPPAMYGLYAPLQEQQPYNDIRVRRDLKYGPDDSNALDIFTHDRGEGGPRSVSRPVLMFVHGGEFTGGSKRRLGSPFYDNIVLFAARAGLVGVNMTYRLAPRHPWPAGAEDVAAAVRWAGDNIAAYGGDPRRIFLMGHSSGAVHVAGYVAHDRFHGPRGPGLAGAILLSGFFDLTAMQMGPSGEAYFGRDTEKYPERSTLAGLANSPLPLMVVCAELDPTFFSEQANRLNEAMCRNGRCPRFVRLDKHNHMSLVYAINTKDTELSDQILAFVKEGQRRAQ